MYSISTINEIKKLILYHEDNISSYYSNKEVEIVNIYIKYDGNIVAKYKILHLSKIDSKWEWYDKEMHINKEDSIRIIRDNKLNEILNEGYSGDM